MSGDIPRWMVIVMFLLFIVGMLVWARGPEHHHGRYVGALGVVCTESRGCWG